MDESILVIGSVNVDLVLKVPELPRAGENVIGDTYIRVPGGKGANQAVAVARLGGNVTFVGKTGNDADGAFLSRNLDSAGVNTEFLLADERVNSGLAVVTVNACGKNNIVVFPGANLEIGESVVRAAFDARPYDAVLLQLETSPKIVIEACRVALDRGVPVFLDAGPAQPFPLEALAPIFIISPNETETLALTGIAVKSLADADRAASLLIQRSGAKAAVLKLGENGAYLRCVDGDSEHFPAFPVTAVDTTAAGDAFSAALAVTYIQTKNLHAAITAGNKAGALATTRFGAQSSLPTAAQLAAFNPKPTRQYAV
ncbi:MAG TPA: PfkB family carbohydrate kinase [Terriglobales bacterium]|nr:PfkB family carbohydrate kinase [Terriglobales bacterium]